MSQPWSSMTFVDVLGQLFSLILRQVDDLDEFRTFLEAASVLEAKSSEPTWDSLFVEYVAPNGVEYILIGSLKKCAHGRVRGDGVSESIHATVVLPFSEFLSGEANLVVPSLAMTMAECQLPRLVLKIRVSHNHHDHMRQSSN